MLHVKVQLGAEIPEAQGPTKYKLQKTPQTQCCMTSEVVSWLSIRNNAIFQELSQAASGAQESAEGGRMTMTAVSVPLLVRSRA